MIELKTGDILQESVDALVNPVNCVGVMGAGLALQFKKAFPENFKAYKSACKNGELKIGKVHVFETGSRPAYIVNFPTKNHWRMPSQFYNITTGVANLCKVISQKNKKQTAIASIAIPPLGCGLGGLYWAEVKHVIESNVKIFIPSVRVILFEPKERHLK